MAQLDEPRVILGVFVLCADTQVEARDLGPVPGAAAQADDAAGPARGLADVIEARAELGDRIDPNPRVGSTRLSTLRIRFCSSWKT